MKKILIVGGSKGIGHAMVELLKESHELYVLSRTEPVSHPNITYLRADVTKDGLPDINADLAGLVFCPGSINLKPLKSLTPEHFREDFELNVVSAVKVIQAYVSKLKQGNGSVVLFSSVAAQLGMPYHTSVAASKAAIEGLTKSLAAEYAPDVTFNCIAPTLTNTPLASKLLRTDKQKESMAQRHPLNKYLEPIEVAELACYLLSEKAKSISGQVFPIAAGLGKIKR